jgi:hypothetical protein
VRALRTYNNTLSILSRARQSVSVLYWCNDSRSCQHFDVGDEMATGKKADSAASKVLPSPKSTPAQKKAAASDLAQTPKKKRGK